MFSIAALNIAAFAFFFINIRRICKKICGFFAEIILSRIIRNTLDKFKKIELYCRFLGSMLFSQGPIIQILTKILQII